MLAFMLLALCVTLLAMSDAPFAPGTIWLTKAAAGEAAISVAVLRTPARKSFTNRCESEIDVQLLARNDTRHQLQVDQRHPIVTREFWTVSARPGYRPSRRLRPFSPSNALWVTDAQTTGAKRDNFRNPLAGMYAASSEIEK